MFNVISVVTSATQQRIVGVVPRARKVVVAKAKICNAIIARALATSRANAQTIVGTSAMRMAATSEALPSGWHETVRIELPFVFLHTWVLLVCQVLALWGARGAPSCRWLPVIFQYLRLVCCTWVLV